MIFQTDDVIRLLKEEIKEKVNKCVDESCAGNDTRRLDIEALILETMLDFFIKLHDRKKDEPLGKCL